MIRKILLMNLFCIMTVTAAHRNCKSDSDFLQCVQKRQEFQRRVQADPNLAVALPIADVIKRVADVSLPSVDVQQRHVIANELGQKICSTTHIVEVISSIVHGSAQEGRLSLAWVEFASQLASEYGTEVSE